MRMKFMLHIIIIIVHVWNLNRNGILCQFATNFKCNESKQSDEYVTDVKIYVNEMSEYFNKRSTPNLDLSTIGVGFLSDEDLDGKSYREILSLNLALNVLKKISFTLILRYPNVQNLDLSQNCLTTLDAKHRIIFQNLSSLNVSRNLIVSIHPFTFSNLSSLEVVDLSYNQLLRFLAADFEIHQLHINDNKLIQIEIDSSHHKELKLLDASNNNLKIFQINVDFNNLILSGNQLTMNDEYFSIRNIYGTLDLQKNHIDEFDWKYISCVTTNLDLSHNKITMLNVANCPLKRFQRLKRLNLDGNFLCNQIKINVTKCFPNLKFISLKGNRLNKAQKVNIKSSFTKMRVKSQIFEYDSTHLTRFDDDDLIAFNIFSNKFI